MMYYVEGVLAVVGATVIILIVIFIIKCKVEDYFEKRRRRRDAEAKYFWLYDSKRNGWRTVGYPEAGEAYHKNPVAGGDLFWGSERDIEKKLGPHWKTRIYK